MTECFVILFNYLLMSFLRREWNGAIGGVSSGECSGHALPAVVTVTCSIKKGSSLLKWAGLACKSGGFTEELSWRPGGEEKNGKRVEALISRDDCTLGGAWRDNACLKKRKVRGGKGEGCGGNKMSYKE